MPAGLVLTAIPSGSQGCFLFTAPGPSLEKHPWHSAQAEAVLQSALEVTRSNADESESPVKAASYLVPAGARECHLIVRTIVTMSWAVTRAMGLLSLVDLYCTLPQWHPGGTTHSASLRSPHTNSMRWLLL